MAKDPERKKKKSKGKKKKSDRREQDESGRMAMADELNEAGNEAVVLDADAPVDDTVIVVEQDEEYGMEPIVVEQDLFQDEFVGEVAVVEPAGEDLFPAPIGEPEGPPPGGEFTEDGLAVATAVDTTGEDEFVYAAIEYDPDSKPPLHKNRRFRVYTCLALVIIVSAVSIAVVYVTKSSKEEERVEREVQKTDKPTTSPTAAPTTGREASGIIEQLEAGVLQRNATFANMTDYDPRHMALEWILHKDRLQLLSDDRDLYQRYVLALLAYSWDSTAWSYCGNHQNYTQEDCVFVEAITGAEETKKIWLSSTSECDWHGVICSDGIVRGLELIQNDLIGSIPAEISKLTFLQYLTLQANCLHGAIPPEFGNMDFLQSLELHGNGLSGELPTEFYEAGKLQQINLSTNGLYYYECTRSDNLVVNNYFRMGDRANGINRGISGNLDNKIGKFRALKGLHLFSNNFYGDLAPEIGDLKFLVFLNIANNLVGGEIPNEITKLNKLRVLRINNNDMYGKLPQDIGDMEDLEELNVEGLNMNGNIPDSLYKLSDLQILKLHDTTACEEIETFDDEGISEGVYYDCEKSRTMGFTGSIKTEIGNLKKLRLLHLFNNPLTGSLPTELGNCEKLVDVRIHKTNIQGSVPTEVCKLRDLDLSGKFYSDCRPNNKTQDPFMRCSCCTDCCDHTTTVCVSDD